MAALSTLPNELLTYIALDLDDPCDMKAFMHASRHLHTITAPIFSSRFDGLEYSAGLDSVIDYAAIDDYAAINDYGVDDLQQYLMYKKLAYIAAQHGWSRLVRAMVSLHNVSPHDTIPTCEPECETISILVIAAARGDYALVKFLLEQGECNPDCVSPGTDSFSDGNFFPNLGKYGQTPLLVAAERGDVAIVDLLLSRGASPDFMNYNGMPPLHAAVRRGHVAVVDRLLRAGADVDIEDWICGLRALQFAVTAERPDIAIVRLLVARGCALDGVNEYGENALHQMMLYSTVFWPDILDVFECPFTPMHEDIMRFLLQSGIDYKKPSCDSTPLEMAVEHEILGAVEILRAHDASVLQDKKCDVEGVPVVEGGDTSDVDLI